MSATLRRIGEVSLFGALPIVALAIGLSTFAEQGRIALDFHHELYAQAELIVDGNDPYPAPTADLSDGTNTIWPIAAVLPVIPLTAVSAEAADWVATALVLLCVPACLLILRVRDWRLYGLTFLWPCVIDAYQTANLTLPLAVLVAVVWRYRDRQMIAGLALGAALALKFFLWPLVLWLLALRRTIAAAAATAIGGASLLLILPFMGLVDYARLIRNLGETFDGLSYTPYALLVDLGLPSDLARAATLVIGAALIALAWRRKSLGLALGAALVLSPIVWRHFFAVLLVPLAVARPRLDAAWFVPLAFWLVPGTYNGAAWQTALGLVVAATVVVACERPASARLENEHRGARRPVTRSSAPAGTASRDARDPRPAA